jgi:hypothetical protein
MFYARGLDCCLRFVDAGFDLRDYVRCEIRELGIGEKSKGGWRFEEGENELHSQLPA